MSPNTIAAVLGQVVTWGDDTGHQVSDAPKAAQFTRVAPGGAKQALALHANGRLALWGGYPTPGAAPSAVVPDLTKLDPGGYIDLAIGVTFAAAIRDADRHIQTWGEFAEAVNGSKVSAVPITDWGKRFSAVTVGGGHGLAIEEGTGVLYQWGSGAGTEPHPPKYKFVEVRSRNSYCLALDEAGDLYGWRGELFARPSPPATHPLAGSGWTFMEAGYWFHKGPFIAIAAGGTQKDLTPKIPHVLALTPEGTVSSWGANTFGERDPPKNTILIEKGGTGSPRFVAIAAGLGFSIGLDDKGELHHWGDPGAIDPSTGKGVLESLPTGPFVSIGAGTLHASAVRRSSPSLGRGER